MQPLPDLRIEVSVARQSLRLFERDELLKEYPVSTSRHGIGFEEGSFKTPLGAFQVAEKIGHTAPWGTVFKSRQPVGVWTPDRGRTDGAGDLVLTRILWLDGLDPDNGSTLARYIYIHGTNHEDLIGSPASMGCVRMRNDDVIELFDLVPEGTPVSIVEHAQEPSAPPPDNE